MAIRKKSVNVRSSGAIIAGGIHNLEYVLLEDDQFLISLQSIYNYLEIDAGNTLLAESIIPDYLCVYSRLNSANEQFGISSSQVPAVCINLIEYNAKNGDYKNEAINAMMLLMFLSSLAISSMVVQDNIKNQPHGNSKMKVSWTK